MATLLFFCDNLAMFSTDILNFKYSNLRKTLFLDDTPVKGFVFLLSNIRLSRTNLDTAPVLGFAFITMSKKRVKILKLFAGVEQTAGTLLRQIKTSTSLPIVVELDFVNGDNESKNMYNFYISHGFKIGKKKPWEKDYIVYISSDIQNQNLNASSLLTPPAMLTNINSNLVVMDKMLFTNLIVKFPISLSATLSPLVQKKYEVGGNICISSLSEHPSDTVKKNYGGHDEAVSASGAVNVLTLSFRSENMVQGPLINQTTPGAVEIPANLLTPFSFHTHPDICTSVYGSYIAWPSAADIIAVVSSYISFSNVLAHFVVTADGIWVIYITPPFQKFLCDLRNSNNFDMLELLISRLQTHYMTVEHYRSSNFIEPALRYKIKNEFIRESNNLLMNTVAKEMGVLYTGENFNLFKLKLLKWKRLTSRDVFLKFPYFIDPPGGFPRQFAPTCLLDYYDITDSSSETEQMEIDTDFY